MIQRSKDRAFFPPNPNPPPPPAGVGLEEVPSAPALVLEPVRITDFVRLITAARKASTALDHFLQLHDPTDADLLALEELQIALMPFLQPGHQ